MKPEHEKSADKTSELISRIHTAIKLLTIKNQGLTTENRALQVKTNQLRAENEQLRAEVIYHRHRQDKRDPGEKPKGWEL